MFVSSMQSGVTIPESTSSVTRKVVNLSLISNTKAKQNKDHTDIPPYVSAEPTVVKGLISLSHLKNQQTETPSIPTGQVPFEVVQMI